MGQLFEELILQDIQCSVRAVCTVLKNIYKEIEDLSWA